MTGQDVLCIWFHEHRVGPPGDAALARWRADVLGKARGHVLEVGARTGTNLSWYGSDVASLTVTEWRPAMFRRLARRAAVAATTTALRAPVEDLPFNDGTFDQVVSTFALCRADDQRRALREIHRVLKPGGELAFLEHVRAADPPPARWQDRLSGLHRAVIGCDCNRPTVDSIRATGFDVGELQRPQAGRPRALVPPVAGTATAIPGHRYPTHQPERTTRNAQHL